MKTETYEHIAERVGKEATEELLDQEPALKGILDFAGNKITGEMRIDSEEQMIINMSDMKHWRLTSISTIPDDRVLFTAQCID